MAPARALAWTDADVTRVVAHVDVDEDELLVSLLLRVQIHGGWLEGLEVADLEPDLALASEKPPWAVDAEDPSRKYRVRASVSDGGRVQISFDRRDSPRRGTLLLGLVYRTALGRHIVHPGGDDRAHVRYTLPGFRAGLDAVQIAIAAPAGATAAEAGSGGLSLVTHEALEREGVTVHVYERAHLPRTVPWTVEVVLPDDAVGASVDRPIVRPAKPSAPSLAPRAESFGLGLVLALLALGSRHAFAVRAKERSARARPLVFGPLPLAITVAGALALLPLALALPIEVELVRLAFLAGLSLERLPEIAKAPARLGRFRAVTEDDLDLAARSRRRARLAGPLLLDATTPLGAAVLLSFVLALWLSVDAFEPLARVAASALFALPFATATRHALPLSPLEKLGRLRAVADAGGGAFSGVRFELVVHEDGSFAIDDARLRALDERFSDGVVRFDLALGSCPSPGGFEPRTALVVVTRAGSPAELEVAARLAETAAIEGPGGLVARVVDAPLAELVARVHEGLVIPPDERDARDGSAREAA
jgi:hypothetical protein